MNDPANVFLTLFDSGYLDKGLALIRSLIKYAPEQKIYVLSRPDHLPGKDVSTLYLPYFKELEETRAFLRKEYGLEFRIKSKTGQKDDSVRYRKDHPVNLKEILRLSHRVLTYRYDFPRLSVLS